MVLSANSRVSLLLFGVVCVCGPVCAAQQDGIRRPLPPQLTQGPPPSSASAPSAPTPAPAAENAPAPSPAQKAEVRMTEKGLMRIDAANSSLAQILRDSAALSGTKVDGITREIREMRIYGVYGPASPRVVLAKLMEGTGYNVMMLGTLANGAPKSMTLTPRDPNAKPDAPQKSAAGDDDDDIAGIDNTPPDSGPTPATQRPHNPGDQPAPPQGMPPVDMQQPQR